MRARSIGAGARDGNRARGGGAPPRTCARSLHESVAHREQAELETVGDSELVKHASQVVLNRILTDPEGLRDVAVGAATHDVAHDLDLAGGEAEAVPRV